MKHYKVIKRNGSEEDVDILKIKKVIQWATKGLGDNRLDMES